MGAELCGLHYSQGSGEEKVRKSGRVGKKEEMERRLTRREGQDGREQQEEAERVKK